MLRTKTNLKTDQEQFVRSNAPTARPLILLGPAETKSNEHKLNDLLKRVNSTTTSPTS